MIWIYKEDMPSQKEVATNPSLKIVEKPAPFSGFFGVPGWDINMRPKERHWNRWDMTRRTNPFVKEQDSTGFEGYFVGLGLPSEEVALRIAEIGCKALLSFGYFHKNEPSFLRKVWKVIKGEVYDLSILAELNACLLENMARLRMQVVPQQNAAGDEFLTNISRLVDGERIFYRVSRDTTSKVSGVTGHGIAVPITPPKEQLIAISVNESTFSVDRLREGYAFMKLLGRAGYPLVGLAMEHS